eukprot:149751-Prymnesium_polylepis.1
MSHTQRLRRAARGETDDSGETGARERDTSRENGSRDSSSHGQPRRYPHQHFIGRHLSYRYRPRIAGPGTVAP